MSNECAVITQIETRRRTGLTMSFRPFKLFLQFDRTGKMSSVRVPGM